MMAEAERERGEMARRLIQEALENIDPQKWSLLSIGEYIINSDFPSGTKIDSMITFLAFHNIEECVPTVAATFGYTAVRAMMNGILAKRAAGL